MKVFMLSGKAGAGKDTAFKLIRELVPSMRRHIPCRHNMVFCIGIITYTRPKCYLPFMLLVT